MELKCCLRNLHREESGIALVMAIAFLTVLSIAVVVVGTMALSTTHSSNYSKSRQVAFNLAEAGVNNAFSILNESGDPRISPLLPARVDNSLPGGSVTYSGVYDSAQGIWTI